MPNSQVQRLSSILNSSQFGSLMSSLSLPNSGDMGVGAFIRAIEQDAKRNPPAVRELLCRPRLRSQSLVEMRRVSSKRAVRRPAAAAAALAVAIAITMLVRAEAAAQLLVLAATKATRAAAARAERANHEFFWPFGLRLKCVIACSTSILTF